ncbi:dephospho-CoA kinase [Inmirania thermothiophila]|uniref:Dephospho-CoA kinase n=1 Tax=Inmirania thermothiophila TaxID=1750597 RepID=A0A3N1XTW6_9GAMM|nr:dephospho-CoA kinase [Inmirania thermothiophila]ROR29698.1 dephospho-CoA kinase [Inmirania thermothiophila]
MLRVGLTGGIASGKSAVAERFARLGVPVIDTDQVAREVVEPGEPALAAVVEAFGPEVLDRTGRLDRRRMRALVFSDPASRRRLEAILHPAIWARTERRLEGLDAPYAVVVVPLLVETGAQHRFHRILVVDAPERLQLERLVRRDRMDEAAARAMIAAQAPRAARLAAADDVIVNDGPPEALDEAVARLHARYRALADLPPPPRG